MTRSQTAIAKIDATIKAQVDLEARVQADIAAAVGLVAQLEAHVTANAHAEAIATLALVAKARASIAASLGLVVGGLKGQCSDALVQIDASAQLCLDLSASVRPRLLL